MLVKDLRTKSTAELNKLVQDLKAELFMLRFKNSTGQLDQPHKISLLKKDIARVFTVLNAKEDVKAPKAEAHKAEAHEAKAHDAKAEVKKAAAPKAKKAAPKKAAPVAKAAKKETTVKKAVAAKKAPAKKVVKKKEEAK